MRIIFLLALLLVAITGYTQSPVQGTITDEQTGEALPFAYITNLTSQKATVTDIQGRFTIEAQPETDTLQVKNMGYITQTVLAKDAQIVRLQTSVLSLNEVVVSANREQEKRTEAPVAISSISAKTLGDNKPTTIDQVLNQTPGVYMVDLGNEQHTMSIRRPIDYGASYLYLEDGLPIRTSGVFNHNALLEINMANVRNIEIIRGPASSIYGSEAIGGAVNFITQKPSSHPTAGISIQGNDIGYKRTDFYASNTFDKVGIRVAGYYANQQDGTLAYSDFDKLALSLTANYYISQNTELVWSTAFIDYYSDMSGSLDSADFYSKTYGSNQTFTNRQVDALRTKLALNHYWNDVAKTTVTGYFRNNSVKQNPSYRVTDDFKPWIPSGNPNLAHGELNDNSFESYGIIVQHKQEFLWMNSSLISGASADYSPNTYKANYIEIFKNEEGIYESFTETDSVLADYKIDLVNTAAYLQGKIEPVRDLSLIAALRFDQFNYHFENALDSNAYTAVLDGRNSFSRVTPKIGVTYDLKNNRGLYANYSQGFVPPQVGELYRGNKIPTLKPVYYSSYEVGGWMAFANEKARVEATLYRMDGRNEIISVLQNDGSTIRQNAGKTTHQGIEYNLQFQPVDELMFRVSGTNALHKFLDYEESGTDYADKRMPQAPEWIANAQVTYKPQYLKGLRASVEWQHIDGYYMDAGNTRSYEGYNIFNVRLGYEWKAFEIWGNMLNATDKLYATVARANKWGQTYSTGNPRNFNVGLAYRFFKR
ncbi:TonB-dependent receptor [Fulvivirga sp. 29W222]|uniref:TonB-dependent receptor n=1 Tax=Fulvivirga marina TaxID=2494733 RepID=A0A937FZ99_9BACT|nr:TonB-dependent receptor [Fulvivirga marina]MBL6447597.1 TonB-dependent receptor [Fulvivirga marina]